MIKKKAGRVLAIHLILVICGGLITSCGGSFEQQKRSGAAGGTAEAVSGSAVSKTARQQTDNRADEYCYCSKNCVYLDLEWITDELYHCGLMDLEEQTTYGDSGFFQCSQTGEIISVFPNEYEVMSANENYLYVTTSNSDDDTTALLRIPIRVNGTEETLEWDNIETLFDQSDGDPDSIVCVVDDQYLILENDDNKGIFRFDITTREKKQVSPVPGKGQFVEPCYLDDDSTKSPFLIKEPILFFNIYGEDSDMFYWLDVKEGTFGKVPIPNKKMRLHSCSASNLYTLQAPSGDFYYYFYNPCFKNEHKNAINGIEIGSINPKTGEQKQYFSGQQIYQILDENDVWSSKTAKENRFDIVEVKKYNSKTYIICEMWENSQLQVLSIEDADWSQLIYEKELSKSLNDLPDEDDNTIMSYMGSGYYSAFDELMDPLIREANNKSERELKEWMQRCYKALQK